MLLITHEVVPSPEQMGFIIQGMRNPLNSWDKMDSKKVNDGLVDFFEVGENDNTLMTKLSKAGADHRKFLRQMPIHVCIKAPLYWWKEFDQYKVGTVTNSCSTMHTIHKRPLNVNDFSDENILDDYDSDSSGIKVGEETLYGGDVLAIVVDVINHYREMYLKTKNKKYWDCMIQLLPSSYNQTRSVSMNYEVLANIYRQRKHHKLSEWREFCYWIETIPYSEYITGD